MTTKLNALQSNAARVDLGIRGAAFAQLLDGLLKQNAPIYDLELDEFTLFLMSVSVLLKSALLHTVSQPRQLGANLKYQLPSS